MNELLFTAMGISIGAAVLNAALGLRRPLDRTYLSFAVIMALVAIFIYLQAMFYRAETVADAVQAVRYQVVIIDMFVACMLVFIPAYTRVHIPRGVLALYWIGLVAAFVGALVSPYGLWYSAEPQLVRMMFHGELYSTVVAQPMGLLQYVFVLYFLSVLLLALRCGVAMIRRGGRRQGVSFTIAVALVLVYALSDIVRDAVGGSWPYVSEFGVVAWGIIMSVQLARDYRAQSEALATAITHVEAQAARLTSILQAMRALEQNMSMPLETLETGVQSLESWPQHAAAANHNANSNINIEPPRPDDQLARLHRAVTRLREFARSLPDISRRAGASATAHAATRAK